MHTKPWWLLESDCLDSNHADKLMLSAGLQPKGGVQKPKASTKPLSKEDQEAIAKREAARARVQKRTLTSFGLA